eukprot:5673987-Prymnesium_polylepis.1
MRARAMHAGGTGCDGRQGPGLAGSVSRAAEALALCPAPLWLGPPAGRRAAVHGRPRVLPRRRD